MANLPHFVEISDMTRACLFTALETRSLFDQSILDRWISHSRPNICPCSLSSCVDREDVVPYLALRWIADVIVSQYSTLYLYRKLWNSPRSGIEFNTYQLKSFFKTKQDYIFVQRSQFHRNIPYIAFDGPSAFGLHSTRCFFWKTTLEPDVWPPISQDTLQQRKNR